MISDTALEHVIVYYSRAVCKEKEHSLFLKSIQYSLRCHTKCNLCIHRLRV